MLIYTLPSAPKPTRSLCNDGRHSSPFQYMIHHGIRVLLQPYLNACPATAPHMVWALEGFRLALKKQFLVYRALSPKWYLDCQMNITWTDWHSLLQHLSEALRPRLSPPSPPPISFLMQLKLNFRQKIFSLYPKGWSRALVLLHLEQVAQYYILKLIFQTASQLMWSHIFLVSWALIKLSVAVRAANSHTIWKRTRRIISDRRNRSLVLTE